MQRDYSEAQLGVLRLSIDRTAKDRYRDYKYKVHCHFKRERGGNSLQSNERRRLGEVRPFVQLRKVSSK